MGKNNRLEILRLLEEGKITSQEALELLDSLTLYNELKDFKSTIRRTKKPNEKFLELQ